MNHGKHGLGLLGGLLVVAAFGLMLFAAGAQAKTAKILMFKADGTKVARLHATAGADDDGVDGVFLVKALNFEIRCTGFSVQEGLVLLEVTDLKLLYEGCEPLSLSLEKISTCHILDPLDKTKLHITITTTLLTIELASGDFGVLGENLKGEILMTGAECVLPEKTVLAGTFCGLIEPATNGTATLLVLFSEAIQLGCLTGATDKLSFGAQTAYIDGRVNMFLTGEHAGYKVLVEL